MVWQAVRRHPILVLLLVMACGAAAAAAWLFLPVAKRTGVVVFHISSQQPALLSTSTEAKVEFNTYKTTQAALVKQRLVLNEALKQTDARTFQLFKGEPDQIAYLEQKLQVDFKVGPEFMRVTIEGD